jgi:hypothetical protein
MESVEQVRDINSNTLFETTLNVFDSYDSFPDKFKGPLMKRKELINNYIMKMNAEILQLSRNSYHDLISSLTDDDLKELITYVNNEWIHEFKEVNCNNN